MTTTTAPVRQIAPATRSPAQPRPTIRPSAAQPMQFKRIPAGKVQGARLILNGVEKWGKTTLGAFAPEPVILMARGETGFATLRQSGLVPDVDCIEVEDWNQGLETVSSLAQTKHQTIVFDALGAWERLCHEHVCIRDFNGDWSDKGFHAYQKGYEVSVTEWLKLLRRLDDLRAVRAVNILVLGHVKVKTFKNPLGADYDRFTADCNEKTWGVTHKWADAILFGTFRTVVVDPKGQVQANNAKGRMKGIGGTERVIYTRKCDAYDAGCRYPIPDEMAMQGPETMWATVWNEITGNAATGDDSPGI